MAKPIFVKPRYKYDSYTDYWRLVELGKYPTCYEDKVDASNPDATYITTMLNLGALAEQGGGWPDAKARMVYWDLEWHDRSYMDVIPGLHEFWTSDRWYAKERGYTFVPLGSHPSLIHVNMTPRWNGGADWDVCLLAYLGPPRRQAVLHDLERRGFRVAPNSAWGQAREAQLERSRLMVHVHQHDQYPTVAAQRFALAASATIPLLSETIRDPYPFRPGVDYEQADRKDIGAVANLMLNNGHGRAMTGSMWNRACVEYRFDKNVERALAGEAVSA